MYDRAGKSQENAGGHRSFVTAPTSVDRAVERQHLPAAAEGQIEARQRNMDAIKNLNCRIRETNQRYNSIPKPFVGSTESRRLNFTNRTSNTRAEMAPKLVNNQYNSPIDLYSMSNIRRTLEAHSELLAPGVKGINFLKSDTPSIKQSEVYKLIKEEEEQRQQQQQQQQSQTCSPPYQQLSPAVSGHPVSVPTLCVQHAEQRHSSPMNPSPALSASNNRLHQHHHQHHQQQQRLVSPASSASLATTTTLTSHSMPTSMAADDSRYQPTATFALQQNQRKPPVCGECGLSIVGVYAKTHDRFVHPHCFNCSTCGTSLKNTGYFTINEKLYCEIHAKQVANLMRINYNFNANKQDNNNETQLKPAAAMLINQSSPVTSQQVRATEETATRRTQYQQHQFTSLGNFATPNPTTTIATMFDKRHHSNEQQHFEQQQQQQQHQQHREIKWTWQPKDSHSVQQEGPSTFRATITRSSTTASSGQRQANEQQQHHFCSATGHQNSMSSVATLSNREFNREATPTRVPNCVGCHAQIHGPYILAGKSTWCGACSRTKFVCSACHRSLLEIGFIEDNAGKFFCESCYETYYAPTCSKCLTKIKGDCLNALGKHWHPTCFVCGCCHQTFGNSSFYMEDNVPYCERDWNILFTTKCQQCSQPIGAGDKWVEALGGSYHAQCFKCSSCFASLEGSTFYCKNGKPYCRLHVRA